MNWNDYRKQIDRAEFDPAFQMRLMRALTAAQQGGKEQNTMKTTRKGLQRVLIAAAVLVFATVGAFAISASLRESARQDIGVTQQETIAEWTEYEAAEITAESQTAGEVTCISTMCSGDSCEIYLLVSGVDEALAEELANENTWCEWDVGHIDTNQQNATVGVRQVAYDADAQQALVRVSATSAYFETASELKMELMLSRDGEAVRVYDEITIPITQSQALICALALPIGPSDYAGTLTGVSVYAGYIEITGRVASLAEAGIDETELDEVDAFVGSWHMAIETMLADAELVYEDGTHVMISQLASPVAGEWVMSGGELAPIEQGQLQMRHVCQQALDLTKITGIVIGGETYSFG